MPLPLFLGFVLACVSENWDEDRWDEWRDVMDGGDGSPRYVDTDAFDHIAGDVVNL